MFMPMWLILAIVIPVLLLVVGFVLTWLWLESLYGKRRK